MKAYKKLLDSAQWYLGDIYYIIMLILSCYFFEIKNAPLIRQIQQNCAGKSAVNLLELDNKTT